MTTIPESYRQAFGDLGVALADALTFSFDLMTIIAGYVMYDAVTFDHHPVHLYSWPDIKTRASYSVLGCDRLGRVWVSTQAKQVDVYTANGEKMFTVGPLEADAEALAFDRLTDQVIILEQECLCNYYSRIVECDLFGQNLQRWPDPEYHVPSCQVCMVHHWPTNTLVMLGSRSSRPWVYDRRGKWTHQLSDLDNVLYPHVTIERSDDDNVDRGYAMAVGADHLLYVADQWNGAIFAMPVTKRGEPCRIVKIIRTRSTHSPEFRPLSLTIDCLQQLYFCTQSTWAVHIIITKRERKMSDTLSFGESKESKEPQCNPDTSTPVIKTLADIEGEDGAGVIHVLHVHTDSKPTGVCIGATRELFVWDGRNPIEIYASSKSWPKPPVTWRVDEVD